MTRGKLVGLVLVLAAVAFVAIVVPGQVIGYGQDGDAIGRMIAEGEADLRAAEAAPDAKRAELALQVNRQAERIRDLQEFRQQRVTTVAMISGAALLVLGFGVWVTARGGRGRAGRSRAGGP